MPAQLLEQIAEVEHIDAGDADGVAQAELIEIVDFVLHAHVVDLVDHQHDRLAGAAEHIGDGLVVGGESLPAVHEEQYHVAGLYGDFGLPAHLLEQRIVACGVYAAGIDHCKAVVLPFAVGVHAVARHAGRILDDGDAPSRHFIEKRRFADVRPSHDGHERFCHIACTSSERVCSDFFPL